MENDGREAHSKKPAKMPKCKATWMRHDWMEGVCARCGATRNPAAKPL